MRCGGTFYCTFVRCRFGLRARVGQINYVLDGVYIPMIRGNFDGGRGGP